jgi:hypothetical protein
MDAKKSFLRIDVTRDLPPRPRPLAAAALSQVFGGCTGEWVECTQNWQCCSNKCAYRVYRSSVGRYVYLCLP